MLLPRGTPREVATRLHAEIVKAMSVPEIREKMVAQATYPVGSTPEQFGAFRKSEQARAGILSEFTGTQDFCHGILSQGVF